MTENTAALTEKKPGKAPAGAAAHNRGADMLKFLLAPFVCFWAFGFPGLRSQRISSSPAILYW